MPKSTRSRAARKPQKPRPDFPLYAHRNGRWCKRVKGKLCYFGKWADDPDGVQALKLWAVQKDQLLAGVPQPQITHNQHGDGTPLHELVNDYLNAKMRRLDSGRLSARTFGEYTATGKRLTEVFGRDRRVESPEGMGVVDHTQELRRIVESCRLPPALLLRPSSLQEHAQDSHRLSGIGVVTVWYRFRHMGYEFRGEHSFYGKEYDFRGVRVYDLKTGVWQRAWSADIHRFALSETTESWRTS